MKWYRKTILNDSIWQNANMPEWVSRILNMNAQIENANGLEQIPKK